MSLFTRHCLIFVLAVNLFCLGCWSLPDAKKDTGVGSDSSTIPNLEDPCDGDEPSFCHYTLELLYYCDTDNYYWSYDGCGPGMICDHPDGGEPNCEEDTDTGTSKE